MNVPVFIGISEDQQIAELREQFKSYGVEIAEESEGFERDLHKIINVCDVCFRDNIDTVDAESMLNSVVSILMGVPHEKSEPLILSFCEKLTKTSKAKSAEISLRVLNNLFNGLNPHIYLRYHVYYHLVKIAGQVNSIKTVFTDVEKLKQWLLLCNISIEQLQKLLRLLHETLVDCKQSETASKIMIELLSTYTAENASQAKDDAVKCIVTSLADPATFLLDHLLLLKPVQFLEGQLIHDLLTIFVAEKLSSYVQFYKANKNFVDNLGLNHEHSLHKMRLLTFMQMAENKKEISFDVISSELQVEPGSIEQFIINVLKTKMVRAKIDNVNRKVQITSTMHRTFGRPQWMQLREVLFSWRQNLHQIQQSMNAVANASFEHLAVKS